MKIFEFSHYLRSFIWHIICVLLELFAFKWFFSNLLWTISSFGNMNSHWIPINNIVIFMRIILKRLPNHQITIYLFHMKMSIFKRLCKDLNGILFNFLFFNIYVTWFVRKFLNFIDIHSKFKLWIRYLHMNHPKWH